MELCGSNPSGAAFRIYGHQFLFGVHVSADSMTVTVPRLDGGPLSRIFFAAGLPDTFCGVSRLVDRCAGIKREPSFGFAAKGRFS
jgi:hypothetical protein